MPEGETQESWLRKEVLKGLAHALRRPDPGRGAGAVRDRDDGHRPDGLLLLLPRGRRHLPVRPRQRHPGRPGPRLGHRLDRRLRHPHHRAVPAGARPAVRAVPEPRAHQPAGCRPRLRRPPARPDGPLRHREVRRRVHRHGQHVRQDQGQERDQGLLAASSATRSRTASGSPRRCRRTSWARASRSPASSTRATRATARPARSGDVRERAGRQEGHRHRQGRRGPDPRHRRARGRGHPVQDQADRPHPAAHAGQGRRQDHRLRLPQCEDMGLVKMDFLGLRNLGVIDHAIENIRENRGVNLATVDPGRRRRPRHPAGRQPRPTSCWPRRHLRRVPARRRRHARAAQADGADPVRGHRGRPRPVPARPDGRQRAHQLRAPQERPPGDRARSTPS